MDLNALPLFPLGTVLFPGGWLPLQIFEVRYLDLMKRCERSGEPFGVVSLQSGQEVRRAPDAHGAPPAETFAPVGTLARLVHVAHQLPHGLWVGEASLMADDASAPLPDELAELGSRLRHVLPEMVQDDGLPALPEADDPCWHDAGWVANRWAERLPLRTPERQRLMSLDNPVWRLELVAEWLDRLARTHAEGQAPG
jgi:Lon protease-like protein